MRLQRKHILIGLAAAIAVYLAVNGIYNYFLSEEQKIKNLFHQMASDIEEKNALGFGKYFTKDASIRYSGFDMTSGEIGPFLWRLLQSYKEIKITFSELSVELKGEQAVVTFVGDAVDTVARTRSSFEGTARLRKVEGEWKVYDVAGRQHRRPRMIF